jgi:hypothetical protein
MVFNILNEKIVKIEGFTNRQGYCEPQKDNSGQIKIARHSWVEWQNGMRVRVRAEL